MMAKLLTPVTVTANGTARAEVSLVRGATIAGAVRFEDGLADKGSRVTLLRRDATGKLKNYAPSTMSARQLQTDDQGRFRFAGLPPGEYKMYTILALHSGEVYVEKAGWAGGLNTQSTDPSWLSVYLGNGFRERDGKSLVIAGVETLAGEDIEIQMSRLHAVSGTVVDAGTGSPVNKATVRILFTELGSHGGSTAVGRTDVGKDGTFRFPFVPDGIYKLTVGSVSEITEEWVPMQKGVLMPIQIAGQPVDSRVPMMLSERTLKSYGDVSQQIIVHGDLGGLTMQVAVKAPAVAER